MGIRRGMQQRSRLLVPPLQNKGLCSPRFQSFSEAEEKEGQEAERQGKVSKAIE